ncbi:MAG: alpha/beta fold hydrolase [Parachlamydiales bacterium]|nr:alpha/beta fold hydrolase [Parachlamydiales bacterium]
MQKRLKALGILASSSILSLFGLLTLCWKKRKDVPILMIHGFCNSSIVWWYHGRKLSKAGFGPLYTINLGSPLSSIEEYAQKVEKKVEDIFFHTQKKRIILIGHSMGGLVAAYYALNRAPPKTVTDVIALGSPFKGTKIALLGMGKCAHQMERNSPFVEALSHQIMKDRSIRFYFIAAERDHWVSSLQSTILHKEKRHQCLIEKIGHFGLLFSDKVSKKIIGWLSYRI